jgi:hypothetical protein
MSIDAPKTGQTERKPTRQRHPSYDVYRQDSDNTLDLIAQDVKAPTRREAIVKATGELPEDRQYGTFATVKHGEVQTITRTRKVEPTDVWST